MYPSLLTGFEQVQRTLQKSLDEIKENAKKQLMTILKGSFEK